MVRVTHRVSFLRVRKDPFDRFLALCVEEAAETVRLIFTDYVGGSGMKTIARTLNEQRRKMPVFVQLK